MNPSMYVLPIHGSYSKGERQRIIISGASGMIGSALTYFLRKQGHTVRHLVRSFKENDPSHILWDPYAGHIEDVGFLASDAIIHLSGANIAEKKWTKERKKEILESRIKTTKFLVDCMKQMQEPPHTFICASAIGYFGSREADMCDEESFKGTGFLSDVCEEWEAAAKGAEAVGTRVVNIRTGMVLCKDEGALPKILQPFKFGVGGKLGDGTQYMSWISLADLLGVYHYCLFDKNISGPVNAVSPHSVTNAEFTEAVANVLHRPAVVPVPSFVIKAIFGEMGVELLLASTRVYPQKLLQKKFEFQHKDLEQFLHRELNC